jgi:hypothetical protein
MCKIVSLEFYCVTLPLLYVTFTASSWSFEPVPVDVAILKGNLRNYGGILSENAS